MSYSEKKLVRFSFPSHDFGDGAEVLSFVLPKSPSGKNQQGQIVNVGVMCHTETWANDGNSGTVVGGIHVGIASDTDKYAKLIVADATADEAVFDVDDDTDAIIVENIPAGTLLELNMVQCTDTGAAAGMGIPFIDMYVW